LIRRVLLSLVLVLALLSRPSRAEEAQPRWEPAKTYAVLVGVLEWKDKGLASFPKENRFDRALERALLAGGVPRDQVTFLEDKAATKEAMVAALKATVARAGEGSTLVFYFAGHGLRDGKEVYLANHDAVVAQKWATAFGVTEMGSLLEGSWKGSRLVLMADCCHSGALGDVARKVGRGARSAVSLTSSTASNVSTGEWTFTESIVKAFSGDAAVDEDGDGSVEVGEIDRFVQREMRFREKQLTEGVATGEMAKEFTLRPVDPATVRPKVQGPWQPGEYCEVESEKKWWRSRILEAKDGKAKVHYLGWEDRWDEWVEPARIRAPRPISWKGGDAVDVEWEGKWYPAKVLRAKGDFALIHYDGFGDEWDEWVGDARIRARGAKEEPPAKGQKKRK